MASITVGGVPVAPSHNVKDDLNPLRQPGTIKEALARDFGIGSTKAQKKAKKVKNRLIKAYDSIYGDYNSGINGDQPSAEKALIERTLALAAGTKPLREIQTQAMDAAEDTSAKANAAVGRGRTDLEAQLAREPNTQDFGAITDQAVRRARGLTRVAIAGDAAIKEQALKDRIAMAGFGRQRAALALGQGQVGVEMGAKRQAAARDAAAVRSAGYSNAAGSVIGAAANYGIGKYLDWKDAQSAAVMNNQAAVAQSGTLRRGVPPGG